MIKLALLCNTRSGGGELECTTMQTWIGHVVPDGVRNSTTPAVQPPVSRPSYLHFVTGHDLENLRLALARGALPPDLQTKLARLGRGDLLEQAVSRHCRCFAELLLAAQQGSFRQATPAQCERLLRVLAYVRREDDFIADYKPGGFVDDHYEVRAATVELVPLLDAFRAWRLRHQVPGMWWN